MLNTGRTIDSLNSFVISVEDFFFFGVNYVKNQMFFEKLSTKYTG